MAPFQQQRRSRNAEIRRRASGGEAMVVRTDGKLKRDKHNRDDHNRKSIGDDDFHFSDSDDGRDHDNAEEFRSPETPKFTTASPSFSLVVPTTSISIPTSFPAISTPAVSSSAAPSPATTPTPTLTLTTRPLTVPTTSSAPFTISLLTKQPLSFSSVVPTAAVSKSTTSSSTISTTATKTIDLDQIISSSAPRKGVDADGRSTSLQSFSIPTASSTKSTATSIIGAVAAVTSVSSVAVTGGIDDEHRPLTPEAEHALIAIGTIGALVLVTFGLYVILRMMKIDVLANLKKGRWQRNSWKAQKLSDDRNEWNPETAYPVEKTVSQQHKLAAFFTPTPRLDTNFPAPAAVAAIDRANTERQDLARDSLFQDPKLYSLSPTQPLRVLNPDPVQPNATFSFYNVQPPPQARQPSVVYNSQRVSDLSSLSSGFGDAHIDVPESGPTPPNTLNNARKSLAYRASRNNYLSRSSWATRDRDTVYTNASEEQPPRFRTVNSWVNQQSRSVARKRENDAEIDNMPELGGSKDASVANHRRGTSEVTNAAFKAHPGDEVEVGRGSRVPSAILDRKFGSV